MDLIMSIRDVVDMKENNENILPQWNFQYIYTSLFCITNSLRFNDLEVYHHLCKKKKHLGTY
jgi:hypothetical protein